MPHLLRTVQKSLFRTDMGPHPAPTPHPVDMPYSADHEHQDKRFAVGVDMTPEEALLTRQANYPQYDLPSVENLGPRTRGKHY